MSSLIVWGLIVICALLGTLPNLPKRDKTIGENNFEMDKPLIKLIYYKCPVCGSRVGMPIDENHKILNENSSYFADREIDMFYCNTCKDNSPHIYCGYRTVEK